MKIKIVFIISLFVFSLIFSGCINEDEKTKNENTAPEESNTNKTVNMNATELIDDFTYSMNMRKGSLKWIMGYKSLDDGDTLILTDLIDSINYTESLFYNATNISFNVNRTKSSDFDKNYLNLLFQGNLTNKYKVGDKVKITVTIEEFIYENTSSNMYYKMDVFKEGWNEDNFLSNQSGFSFMSIFGSFLQVLSESCIEKI